MSILNVLWVATILVVCRAVPDGYILQVSHSCGDLVSDEDLAAVNASVTIKSDLHAMGHLKCKGNFNLRENVDMNPIGEDSTQSTTAIYYPGDPRATVGCCSFFHPPNSNLYVAELEVFWGFTNGTLMNDYETYTITCTVNGNANASFAAVSINDDAISVTENLEENLGNEFSDSSSLKLIDVLGNEITDSVIPMGKKVRLELSIDGSGSGVGITPYDCEARNSADTKSFKILNAGCGDGVIFPKNEGFTSSGLTATSPIFKAFKLIESLGTTSQISYKCYFANCNETCAGSSCALRRTKRSAVPNEVEDANKLHVKSQNYRMSALDKRLDRSEMKLLEVRMDSRLRLETMVLSGVGVIALLSFIMSLYSCARPDQRTKGQ